MNTKETIITIVATITVFALIIAMIVVAPVEIEGNAVIDLDTKFKASDGGTVYTLGLDPLFDGKPQITLDRNTSLTLGINKVNVSWRIKTPIVGLWLFKDDIQYIVGH